MGRRVTVEALNCRRITLISEFVCSTVYMRTFFQASIDDMSQAMWEVYSNFNQPRISSATGTTINTTALSVQNLTYKFVVYST